jgi:outer membrane protein
LPPARRFWNHQRRRSATPCRRRSSSQSSLDSTKLGQEVGVRTQVDVLNATQQLISTRRDYAQAIYNYAINVLKLKSAAGTLTEDDVVYMNQWLQN